MILDFTRTSDLIKGCNLTRLGLQIEGDDTELYDCMLAFFKSQPDVITSLFIDTIKAAKVRLNQDRRYDSAVRLFYPVDTAIRVIAQREAVLDGALSSERWSPRYFEEIIQSYREEIISLASSNTTSKNLPHRAAHIAYLINNTRAIAYDDAINFIDLGTSYGFILDALLHPKYFAQWRANECLPPIVGGKYISIGSRARGVGIDLVTPSLSWTLALVHNDSRRKQVERFAGEVPHNQNQVTADASDINDISAIQELMHLRSRARPFVIACLMLYQLEKEQKDKMLVNIRSFLTTHGGGFLLITESAKNVGYGKMGRGCVSWIENEKAEVVSPKLFITDYDQLSQWTEIK